jgi:hypothetical protein
VSVLGRRGELHLPERRRYDNAVLVETRREGIRIEHRTDAFYVCYTSKSVRL